MLQLFISAFVLGVLFNATPGAVFAESLRRGLRGGYRPALAVQIGSLLGDFLWAVLALIGAQWLLGNAAWQTPLAMAGALLLAWLGWGAVRDGLGEPPAMAEASADRRSAMLAGAALSLTNPWNLVYWVALAGTVAALGQGLPPLVAQGVFLAGFMLSSVLWCFVCAGAIAWLHRRIERWLWKALHFICGGGLIASAGLVMLKLR